ncbi:MAG: DUF4118 domain-containing protein [Pseudomonadales bacterium]|nr:DUF4118 domain-containing protein [Pseudomonadales bacterium]
MMSLHQSRDQILPWILPWLVPILATLAAWALSPILSKANFAMIYLAGVLFTAMSTHVKPALVCALLSFLAYNFFYTEPHFTLFMIHRDDILTGSLLILVAVVTGHLAASLREKVVAMEANKQWNNNQVALARELSVCINNRDVVQTLSAQIESSFQFLTQCFLQDPNTEELISLNSKGQTQAPRSTPPEISSKDNVTFQHSGNHATIFFYTNGSCHGLVEVIAKEVFSFLELNHLESFVGMAHLAWDRVQLSDSLRQEIVKKEREQLRSALLSSVSHDLKTPLAIMIGSVSSLIDLHDDLDKEQREELARNTLSEAQRLDRHIQKLLDMARLGHGELTLDRDWIGLEDIVSVVIKRSKSMLGSIAMEINLQPDLPLIYVHPALIEQALFNVLENAIRFAPEESVISINGYKQANQLQIDIHDQGPGIPPESWDNIFDMFYTLSYGDRYPSGTGVGLAISQGILKAHGGAAHVVKSSPESGTTIQVVIPLPQPHQTA